MENMHSSLSNQIAYISSHENKKVHFSMKKFLS